MQCCIDILLVNMIDQTGQMYKLVFQRDRVLLTWFQVQTVIEGTKFNKNHVRTICSIIVFSLVYNNVLYYHLLNDLTSF